MFAIYTHPGQAHRDDFIACCVLMARHPTIAAVHRQTPDEAALDSQNAFVVDVGGRYEPRQLNFDHHQFGRDEAPTCALTLVLKHLGLYQAACAASTWIGFTELLDSKGPKATQTRYDIGDEAFYASLSPIEAQLLIQFGKQKDLYRGSSLFELMVSLGEQWISYWTKFGERLGELRSGRFTADQQLGVDGVLLVSIPADQDPTLALEAFCRELDQERGSPIRITVTRDDRGPGWCLFRRNDAVGVDFSKLEGNPLVTFAHKGGFVAKTKDCTPRELEQLIALAVCV